MMRPRITRRKRGGAAAIEFALCFPIFLAIVFAIMEFGWVFFQQANVVAAVREGLRGGVPLPQEDDCIAATGATDIVKASLRRSGYSDSQISAATITQACSGSTPEEALTVTVEMPYTALIGIIPTPDHIHAEMTMILELQD